MDRIKCTKFMSFSLSSSGVFNFLFYLLFVVEYSSVIESEVIYQVNAKMHGWS
jgi:hypothetical protein